MISAVTNSPTASDDEISVVIAKELVLLEPATRSSPDAVLALLHEAFREFGASGRIWDRPAIVAALAAEPGPGARAEDMRAVRLAPHVIHLTYVARRPGRASLRSSLWLRDAAGWRLLFHQGTRCGDDVVPPAANRA
jgi:hypothetical protein